MPSEAGIPEGDEGYVVNRPSTSKKSQNKAPKKIHKAEREKQKRDHLNVLFLELSKAVESTQLSSGKASTMNDTIRLLKELLAQVDCLEKENAALISESQYVTNEKNELYEENSALQSQMEKLQSEIMDRTYSQSSMNLNLLQSQSNIATSELQEDHLGLPAINHQPQSASVVGQVFIVPLQNDSQVHHHFDIPEAFPSNVKKPQPRYPSPSDSWPSHILDKQLNRTGSTREYTGSVSSVTSSGGNLGLGSD